MASLPLSHLDQLEAESIHIIREVAAECAKPVMLYSIGKDSAVMLHLALKAFYPGRLPFPLLHVDTTWKFRDMIAFRDRTARRTAALEDLDGSWKGITGSQPGAGPRRDDHRPAAAGAIPRPQYILVIIQAPPRPSGRVHCPAAASHHAFVPGRPPRWRRRPARRPAALGRRPGRR